VTVAWVALGVPIGALGLNLVQWLRPQLPRRRLENPKRTDRATRWAEGIGQVAHAILGVIGDLGGLATGGR
jgi:hypothetical protein